MEAGSIQRAVALAACAQHEEIPLPATPPAVRVISRAVKSQTHFDYQ